MKGVVTFETLITNGSLWSRELNLCGVIGISRGKGIPKIGLVRNLRVKLFFDF